ncbi:hypothetical protein QE152_g1169 [Popillia japonica]|uniref:Uncharacterized protein n=1 Tax=Popillia japonica TaxID=7064 RepID=A0AAW1NCE8_POPJA
MEARLRDNSFIYKVRVVDKASTQFKEIVCQIAFISLHGITNRRIITLKGYLQRQGGSCRDKRETHQNRPHKLNQERLESIHNHIKSFKGRKSHYSLKDSRRIYLPETLNVKNMYRMYAEQNRLTKPVSYETYRNILFRDFNIGFDYPRSDTCSSCDATKIRVASLESQLTVVQAGTPEEGGLKEQLRKVETDDKLHKLRASASYKRKRIEKKNKK